MYNVCSSYSYIQIFEGHKFYRSHIFIIFMAIATLKAFSRKSQKFEHLSIYVAYKAFNHDNVY